MEPGASSMKRAVLFALPITFGLPLIGGLVAAASRGFSACAAFSVFATLVLVAFVALTHRRVPRAGIVAATCAGAWAGFLALGAMTTLREDAIVSMYEGSRCGTGTMMLYIVTVPLLAAVTLGLGLGVGVALAHPSNDRFVRGIAFVATAVPAVLLAFEVPRTGMPDPDSYLRSLPVVRTMNQQSGAEIDRFHLEYVRTATASADGNTPRFSECHVSGFADPVLVREALLGDEPCPALRFLRDEASSLLIVETRVLCVGGGDDCWYPIAAIRTKDGAPTKITPEVIASRLAAPIGWRVGAAFGFVAALGLLAFAVRVRRRVFAERIDDAVHHGDGRIELDGRSILYPAAMSLPKGPVMLFGVAEREGSYRAAGAPEFARAEPGTSAQRRERMMDLAASVTATAMAVATLGLAPLLIARFFGL